MSNPKKRDIADFFKPYQRANVPQKRSTPEPDFDELQGTPPTRTSGRPRTPPSSRKYSSVTPSRRAASRPLATPRNDRTVLIPIRDSPQAKPSPTQPVATPHSENAQSARFAASTSPGLAFRDSPSANRTTVLNSKPVVIRDSDEEDNESLESLADIVGRNKNAVGSGASFALEEATPEQREVERSQLLSKWTGGRSAPIVGKDKLRRLLQHDTRGSLNLTRFINDDLLDDRAQANIAEAEEEIRASALELENSRQAEIDRKLLAKVVRDGLSEDADPDTTARLLSAVDRTEALMGDRYFLFFGLTGINDQPLKRPHEHEFPSSDIPVSMWNPADSDGRERAYLSGFMVDQAERGLLSSAVLRWTFEAALSEPKEDLRQMYVSVIANDSSGWTHANVNPEDLQMIFTHLGAESNACRDSSAIQTTYSSRLQQPRRDPVHLVSALELLLEICPSFDFATLSKLCSLLCRLVLDSEVMSQVQLSSLLEALLTKVTDLEEPDLRNHVHERIAHDLTTNLEDPVLQASFLSHLIPSSAHAAKLRTDLAMIFLLATKSVAKHTSSYKSDHSSQTNPLKRLRLHVSRSSVFSATQSSSTPINYAVMSASIALLDAAIADGHPDTFVSAMSLQQVNVGDQDPATKSGVFTDKTSEKEFNAAVDGLADKLHMLFANIVDSGASHMRRTEAKDALQALHYRLLFAVRTKPRKRKHVFDFEEDNGKVDTGGNVQKVRWRDVEEVEGQERGKEFMQRFFKNRDVAKVPT